MRMPDSRTLPHLLAEMAMRAPDHPFLHDGGDGRRWSYAAFRAEVRRTAKGMHALGVRRGDRIAVLMGNQAEWLLAAFAAMTLGASAAAINTWWRAQEIGHALRLADVSMLVMAGRYLRLDYAAELATLGDRAAALPTLRHIVCVDDHGPPDALSFAGLVEAGGDVPDAVIDAAEASLRADDLAYICFTSGSTARAKAVPLRHGGLVENMHGIGGRMHLAPDDRLLLVVSLFWAFGCVNAMTALMTHGGSVVLQRQFDPAETLALIARERCTVLYAMPNMAMALLAHPDRARRDLSSLRTGLTMPYAVRAMAELGATEVTTCYGLTEGYGNSAVTDCRAPLERRATISGTALPGTEIAIVDPATRLPLPQGEVGEVRLRGYITPGYLGDPERTAEAIDAEGWFHTGDLAALDAEGGLHFRGRIKEMIKTGGINVAPAEVEEVLLSHPAVRQAIVVGLPDPEREEAIAAIVVAQPGMTLSAAELTAFCRDRAAAFKVPRRIEIVAAEEVPLTDTGKVSRRLVQDRLAAGRGEAA